MDTFPNASGPFPKFPNYPTVSTNFGKFIQLTNEQVNLLSTYTLLFYCMIIYHNV